MAERTVHDVRRGIATLDMSVGIRQLEMRGNPSKGDIDGLGRAFVDHLSEMAREDKFKTCKQVLCTPIKELEGGSTRPFSLLDIIAGLTGRVMEHFADMGDFDGRYVVGEMVYRQLSNAKSNGTRVPIPGLLKEYERREFEMDTKQRTFLAYDSMTAMGFESALKSYNHGMAAIKEDLYSMSGRRDSNMHPTMYPLTYLLDVARDRVLAEMSLGRRYGYDENETSRRHADFRRLGCSAEELILGTADRIMELVNRRAAEEELDARPLATTRLLRDAINMIGAAENSELAYAILHKALSAKRISFTSALVNRGYKSNREPTDYTPVYVIDGIEHGAAQQHGSDMKAWSMRRPDYLGDVLRSMLRLHD